MAVNIMSVAKQAGVAASTVSLVLRNRPRVSEETRAAVMAAVRELGYEQRRPGRPRRQPGEPVTAKRTNRIALVVPDMTTSKLYAPVYMDVLQGVESAIHQARKTMVLRHVYSGRPVVGSLLFSRMDGVLVFGELQDAELVRQLDGVPVVQMMHAAQPGERWDRVTYDNAQIGPLAARYALERGHRNCAFVGHICGKNDMSMQQRGLDFREVINASGGRVHFMLRDLLHITDRIHAIHRDVIHSVAAELAAMNPRPTLVFTEADMVAQALYPALQQQGLAPGADVAVVSCNNEAALLAMLRPRPATVDIHAMEVGRSAVERLLWRIQHPDEPVETILLTPSLIAEDATPS
jgi:LacI family transcriptional regulator